MTVSAAAGGSGPDEVLFTRRGSMGALRLSDWYRVGESEGTAWREPGLVQRDPRQEAYQAQLRELLRFARGEPHGLPDAADALRVQTIIETILAS